MRGLQLTWYVFSGAWKLWPCVNQRAHFPLELPALLPFNFFARFFGMAVGEASHPGPPSDPDRRLTKLVVSNPTAVGADVVVLSETSATSVVQIETTGKLFKKGFRCFWSKPVPNKKCTLDDRPSYRGEAIGICFKVPSRRARVSIPSYLWDSCRVCCSIVRFHAHEILLVSIYGFATRYQHGTRMNDVFLAALFDLVQQVDIPFIIAGDFNDPPHQLPAFSLFREVGAIAAFSYFKSTKGIDLPATCLGSTRNDAVIWLVPLVSDIGGLVISFHKWSIPCSWAAIAPPRELIEKFYNHKPVFQTFYVDSIHDECQTEHALVAWSQSVELAVDKAVAVSHKLNPVVHPWPSLHPKFKGRCKLKATCKSLKNGTVREDPTGAFNPDVEVFSTKSRQVIKQVGQEVNTFSSCTQSLLGVW